MTALKIAIVVLGSLVCATTAIAQTSAKFASSGIYSSAQATNGAALYAKHCARCHGSAMSGQDVTPPLVGPAFLTNWRKRSAADLAGRIRTSMPLDQPGTLGLADSAALVAALLNANGYPSGKTALPPSPSLQQYLMIDSPPAGKR